MQVLKRKALQKVATRKKSKKEREPRKWKPFSTSHCNDLVKGKPTVNEFTLDKAIVYRVPEKANKNQRSVNNDKETSKHLQRN